MQYRPGGAGGRGFGRLRLGCVKKHNLAILVVLIFGVAAVAVIWTRATREAPLTNIAEYEAVRARIAREAPAKAVAALPEHVPQSAREARMWAEVRPEQGRSLLLLLCRVPSEEAARIASEARGLVGMAKHDWRATDPTFRLYSPSWDRVMPEAVLGHDLPGTFDMMLWQNDRSGGGLGTREMGTNAGVLVDEHAGTVIWWVQDDHVVGD